MKSVATEAQGGGGGGVQPRIVGVCLIPEPVVQYDGYGHRSQALEVRLNDLQKQFSLRFTSPYYVSVRDGLVPVADGYEPSRKNWADLGFDARHVYITQLRQQLAEELADGRPCLCLLGSLMAQGLRRVGLCYTMPLSSMSRYQRRSWLEHRIAESNELLMHRLFGRPILSGEVSARSPATASARGL